MPRCLFWPPGLWHLLRSACSPASTAGPLALFYTAGDCAIEECLPFAASEHSLWQNVREFGLTIPRLAILATFIWLAWALFWPARRKAQDIVVPMLAAISAFVGPLVIVNWTLKELWGRPRPFQTTMFGGEGTYVSPGTISDQCASNCSFVSGEAAAAFWLVWLVFIVPRPWRPVAACQRDRFCNGSVRPSYGFRAALPVRCHNKRGHRHCLRDRHDLGAAKCCWAAVDRQAGGLVECPRERLTCPIACKPTAPLSKSITNNSCRTFSMPKVDKSSIKKVVLAYSGGLDTSIILKWLQTEYGAEVVTFTADLGQSEIEGGAELEEAKAKAENLGIKEIYIEDVREEFVRDFVFPMFRANAAYEGVYLLGTSIARPLISKRLVEIARETGADAIAHGATGKGNDQVRFELAAYALDPNIKVIAPWREWEFKSRTDLIAFAEEHQIQVAKDKRGEAPFSVDANLLHSSSEGKVLEDPADPAPEYVHMRTISPMDAPDTPVQITVGFHLGDAVSIDGETLSPAALLSRLNALGKENGIGRLDLVENRFVGMKSRGVYETPGGTILLTAHRAMESITLDSGAAHLKDELMPRYAELIYNGFWFSPEREMLQAAIDHSQRHVEGEVTLTLYKGNVIVTARSSPKSLYSEALVTFEDDAGAYDQADAHGFIQLNALRLRTLAARKAKFGSNE